jgi:hypothetical protein
MHALENEIDNPKVFDSIFNEKDVSSVYINGSKVPSTTYYKGIKLSQEIAIVYGKPPADNNNIPSTYDFPPRVIIIGHKL